MRETSRKKPSKYITRFFGQVSRLRPRRRRRHLSPAHDGAALRSEAVCLQTETVRHPVFVYVCVFAWVIDWLNRVSEWVRGMRGERCVVCTRWCMHWRQCNLRAAQMHCWCVNQAADPLFPVELNPNPLPKTNPSLWSARPGRISRNSWTVQRTTFHKIYTTKATSWGISRRIWHYWNTLSLDIWRRLRAGYAVFQSPFNYWCFTKNHVWDVSDMTELQEQLTVQHVSI